MRPLLVSLMLVATPSFSERFVSVSKPVQKEWKVPLPESAVLSPKVDDVDAGEIPWAFSATSDWFSSRLSQAGWRPVIRETLSERNPKGVVSVWARGEQRLFLMLWELKVDRTGFRCGREKRSGQNTSGG